LYATHARFGISLLAVLPDDPRVVVLVRRQKVLGVAVGVDQDHAERVVHVAVRAALAHEVLQEGREHLEAVSLAHLLDQGADGEEAADAQDEVLQKVLGALLVEQRADDVRGVAGVHLLDVPLDVPHHVVLEQVRGQVADEVEAVAHVDERARVRKLRLHQEHLRLLRVVKVALARDALHLLDLPRLGARLDVLEVDVRVLRRRDERAEVEEQTLRAVVLLEQAHDGLRGELLGVLLADVDDDLQILPLVRHQELADALERPLAAQGAEPLGQRLRVDGVRVDAAPLQVRHLGVVLQRAHVQPGFLAQLRDARAVVVRQLPLAQDGVRDVGERHEVDLQHLRL
jgi:hypothetical protein